MTERERLIMLLYERISTQECSFSPDKPLTTDSLADYLLDHGVIVFPCKVGAPVYVLTPDKQDYYKTRAFPLVTLAKWVQNGDFGKNVFLTIEEAEAELAERGVTTCTNS
jgi:hypothetical protein